MTISFTPPDAVGVWQRAAAKVLELRRDDLSGAAHAAWNEALTQASRALEEEARDLHLMAEMAHHLIVGNVGKPLSEDGRSTSATGG